MCSDNRKRTSHHKDQKHLFAPGPFSSSDPPVITRLMHEIDRDAQEIKLEDDMHEHYCTIDHQDV
jgi:hypothetical protein